ncbi:hypothetical protein COLO4_33460 [Corchorus olitorius]|uniref:Uncharacterized protein n=1 Tax=Corchorus olitorius TaxID=93759 RepID=A0A1R3GTA3_9ROSI|nr:hypothetical protein COLO4_33460 [Corchorus olitorius]
MRDGSSRYRFSESGVDLVKIPPKSSRSTLYRTGLGFSERKSPPWGERWTILGKWATGARRAWQRRAREAESSFGDTRDLKEM